MPAISLFAANERFLCATTQPGAVSDSRRSKLTLAPLHHGLRKPFLLPQMGLSLEPHKGEPSQHMRPKLKSDLSKRGNCACVSCVSAPEQKKQKKINFFKRWGEGNQNTLFPPWNQGAVLPPEASHPTAWRQSSLSPPLLPSPPPPGEQDQLRGPGHLSALKVHPLTHPLYR